MSKNILVVTSCTGEKLYKPGNQLVWEDFQDPAHLERRKAGLVSYTATAGEMYTGKQHNFLMEGVRRYRETGARIDVAVVSAGFGLLREEEEIVPYEVTFNSMTGTEVQAWANKLEITEDIQEMIDGYDLVFFLLGDKYLQSIKWPLRVREDQQLIFFAGSMSRKRLQEQPNSTLFLMGTEEASLFGAGLIWLKGQLFADLLDHIVNDPTVTWDLLFDKPELIRDLLLERFQEPDQLELFDDYSTGLQNILPMAKYVPPYQVEDNEIAPNYKSSLSYFMPENDDRVDPNYNFERDEHRVGRIPLEDDFYAHDFYDAPNYDGILISKVNIDRATQRKKQLIQENGIRQFLRLPDTTQIMGDCGAFSYISADVPPYTTLEVLEYYQSLGYDFGVSVDHLIVGPWMKDETERMRRYDLTLANAEDFLVQHRRRNYSFKPIGVAQGWDPASFRDAVERLIKMGYHYVALGGLAKEKSTVIFEILKAIAPVIPDSNFRMHLFGVARDMNVMHTYHKLGVTSFDSASPLRRAWMDSKHNYYTSSGETFTALRLPEAHEGKGRLKAIKDSNLFQLVKDLERKAFELVHAYGKGRTNDLEAVLEALLAYDDYLGGNRKHHAVAYRHLLEKRPWEQCSCSICKQLGIDVVVFRGNNRNRRRGFHNTHVYFEQLKELRRQLFQSVVTN